MKFNLNISWNCNTKSKSKSLSMLHISQTTLVSFFSEPKKFCAEMWKWDMTWFFNTDIFYFYFLTQFTNTSRYRLAHEYGMNTEFTELWDRLQSDKECCGVAGSQVRDRSQYVYQIKLNSFQFISPEHILISMFMYSLWWKW